MIKRNPGVFVLFALTVLSIILLEYLNIYDVKTLYIDVNEDTILTGILTFSTLTTAFLFFSFSIVPLLISTSNLYKDFGFDIKYVERLILYIFLFLLLSILTILLMIFDWNIIMKIFFIIWVSLFITSTASILSLVILLLKTVDKQIKVKTVKNKK